MERVNGRNTPFYESVWVVQELSEIKGWRRRRDSNPRYGNTPYGGLANRWFQPLTHVSGSKAR